MISIYPMVTYTSRAEVPFKTTYIMSFLFTLTATAKLRKPWTPEILQESWMCRDQSQYISGHESKHQNQKLMTVAVRGLVFWCSLFSAFHNNTTAIMPNQSKKNTVNALFITLSFKTISFKCFEQQGKKRKLSKKYLKHKKILSAFKRKVAKI